MIINVWDVLSIQDRQIKLHRNKEFHAEMGTKRLKQMF